MGKQAAVKFVVLEVIRNPQPQQKAEHGKAPNQFLRAQPEISDTGVQQDDEMDFPEDDQT